MILIRNAQILDAKAIAKIHISSWQVIYRGHVPDNVLDNLSLNEREKLWTTLLENNVQVLVMEEDKNLIGFVSFCPSRDHDADPTIVAEISAIYLKPDKWRKGFGKLLLNTAIEKLGKLNYSEVTLWVVDSNEQAKQFYKSLGFTNTLDEKIEQSDSYSLHEIRYRKNLK